MRSTHGKGDSPQKGATPQNQSLSRNRLPNEVFLIMGLPDEPARNAHRGTNASAGLTHKPSHCVRAILERRGETATEGCSKRSGLGQGRRRQHPRHLHQPLIYWPTSCPEVPIWVSEICELFTKMRVSFRFLKSPLPMFLFQVKPSEFLKDCPLPCNPSEYRFDFLIT